MAHAGSETSSQRIPGGQGMRQQPLDTVGKLPRGEGRPNRNFLNSRDLRRFLVVQSIIQRHRAGHLPQSRLPLANRRQGSVCPCVIVNRSLKHGIRLRLGILDRPMSEILGHIHMVATSDHRDSDHVVVGIQDVGSMPCRIHQCVVSGYHIITEANVFRLPVRGQVLIGEANLHGGLSVEFV